MLSAKTRNAAAIRRLASGSRGTMPNFALAILAIGTSSTSIRYFVAENPHPSLLSPAVPHTADRRLVSRSITRLSQLSNRAPVTDRLLLWWPRANNGGTL